MQIPINDPKLFRIFANPYYWCKKSEEMKKCADLLKVELDRQLDFLHNNISNKELDLRSIGPLLSESCFAMYGFSIECLLKGVIIWKHPEYTTNGKIYKGLKSHDLIYLAKMANFDLSETHHRFCINTNRYMLQFRYPVPNNMEETQFTKIYNGNFFDIFNDLFNELYSLIKGFNIFGHDEDRCPKCLEKKSNTKIL